MTDEQLQSLRLLYNPAPAKGAMTALQSSTPNSRRMILRIGTGFLPLLFGEGLHAYRVTENPLPKDAEIIGVQMGPGFYDVVLLIQSDEFAETPDGQPYREIQPVFTRVDPKIFD